MFENYLTNVHSLAGESSRDRDRDYGVSVYLMSQQNGLCFDCGEAPATEFAHFARGAGRAVQTDDGLIPLGAMACRRCNLIHDGVTAALGTEGSLPVAYFAHRGNVGRITTTLPGRAALVRLAREDREATDTGMRDDIARLVQAIA